MKIGYSVISSVSRALILLIFVCLDVDALPPSIDSEIQLAPAKTLGSLLIITKRDTSNIPVSSVLGLILVLDLKGS